MDTFMAQFESSNNPPIPSSSNASGLFLPPTSAPQSFDSHGLHVEKLQMGDLMKNHLVQGLFSQVMENAAYQKKLFQQVNDLQAENAQLKEEMARREQEIAGFSHHRISSESISPSDSISQTATSSVPSRPGVNASHQAHYRAGQATRPAEYPESVIWNLEDCKLFPGIVTETNHSRPAMDKCIRRENGTEISVKEYRAIRASARLLVNVYLNSLKPPSDPAAQTRTKTKTYYSKYFPQVWNDVLEKLEDSQPLVRLCASHWKAEHIIANCLQANIDDEKKKRKAANPTAPSEGYGSGNEGRQDVDVVSAGLKRRPDSPDDDMELPGKRKKQKTKKSAKTDRNSASKPSVSPAVGTSSRISLNLQLSSLGHPGGGDDVSSGLQHPSEHQPSDPQTISASNNMIDIGFIYVDTKFSSLKDELADNFPLIATAADLLNAMELHPNFGGGTASDNLLSFLTRIETADPNSSDLSEDDTNASWGHSQFTAGQLTWSKVLTSWNDVGSCTIACRLLAAAVKTCKVARHLCFERQITAGSYLSDIYLEQIVDALWKLWKDAGGPVLKGKTPQNRSAPLRTDDPETSSRRTKTPLEVPPAPDGPAPGSEVDPVTEVNQPETTMLDEDDSDIDQALKELEKLLQAKNIVKEELKTWIKVNKVPLTATNKQPTKQDLIFAILKDTRCKTQPAAIRLEFQKMLDERKEGRKASSKNST